MKTQLLFGFLLISNVVFAEKDCKGYYVVNGDTNDVTFKISINKIYNLPVGIQNSIDFYDENGEIAQLRPNEAELISFSYNNINYFLIPYTSFEGKKIFIHVNNSKKLTLSCYSYIHFSVLSLLTLSIPYEEKCQYYYRKINNEIVEIRRSNFAEVTLSFFSDCPILCEKIISKEFRYADKHKVEEFYNNHCHTQLTAN